MTSPINSDYQEGRDTRRINVELEQPDSMHDLLEARDDCIDIQASELAQIYARHQG